MSNTVELGNEARRLPETSNFDLRNPLPIIAWPVFATWLSMIIGHSGGRPIGVMPPYSILVILTAKFIGANETFRASRCLRTIPFISVRLVASITHAAYHVLSARFASTITQLADLFIGISYASQNAAVSARVGSISATSISVSVLLLSLIEVETTLGINYGRLNTSTNFSLPNCIILLYQK